MQFTSMDNFHYRRLLPGEPLSMFVEVSTGSRNAWNGYSHTCTTLKQLLIHQFLTGILSKQLCAVGDIDDLDKLIQRAKLLMTLDCGEKAAAVGLKQQTDAVEALQQKITALTEQVAALTTQRRNSHSPSSLLCFRCNRPGHVQRNCPNRWRQCYTCGRPGHVARECHSGNGNGVSRLGVGHPWDM